MSDELDQRLYRLLTTRAELVAPHLDGPALRAIAADAPSPLRRLAAPLLLAAAVVVLALTPMLLSGSGSPSHREQPGVSVSVPIRPSEPSPSSSPTQMPTSTNPSLPFTQTPPTIAVPSGPATSPQYPPGSSELPTASSDVGAPSASRGCLSNVCNNSPPSRMNKATGTAGARRESGAPVKSLTSTRFAFAATGVLAGSALCLVLAGPASADTTTPPAPSPAVTTAPVGPLPTLSPSLPPSTGPIEVPAGNAKSTPAGSDATAITLLGAGGVLVAGAGVVAARRRA